ncbi:hypothetical protein J11TS1_37970 [Oceanobacillus sp. J11TS1]|nr:hypothetical protein J11TS1_37970 [Oceanobacillus sp. J11TS1]
MEECNFSVAEFGNEGARAWGEAVEGDLGEVLGGNVNFRSAHFPDGTKLVSKWQRKREE